VGTARPRGEGRAREVRPGGALMFVVLVNRSADPAITQALLERIAAACARQMAEDYAPMWQAEAIEVTADPGRAGDPNACVIPIVDQLPAGDDPQLLAYHTKNPQGRPSGIIGWGRIRANDGTLLEGSVSLSCDISHEILETARNPYVSDWSDMPDGREVAAEIADPVQDRSYPIDGVSVCDFVGPRWFDAGGPGPYDKLGVISAPLEKTLGGYRNVRTGGPTGTTASEFGAEVPEWKRGDPHPASRRAAVCGGGGR
jgi:hypothetical protein